MKIAEPSPDSALTLLMKHIRHRDSGAAGQTLAGHAGHFEDEQITCSDSLLSVMLQGTCTVEFLRTLAERLPQHGDSIMTMAERLESKRYPGYPAGSSAGAQKKHERNSCQGSENEDADSTKSVS